ncbi:MAG: alanine--tRNA ligase [Pseudomonadota bacterium]|nr:alanine--tRNA ligase [Pseudomonadota bacterium]HJO35501.1 alanine--tRNA ligase [Gammaproteobacteria bacterium]
MDDSPHPPRSSAALRRSFLDFFASHGHTPVPSASLVPASDPTLLFTNAGMVPFKDVFLGRERRPYVRAASAQRCVRAGGKHNDLENVGYTARHHTFFEMLGNFSFGDYFKREAIGYAWQYLTEVLRLPPERLWVTVYEQDEQAAAIWLEEIGVDPARFARIGARDNFWSMGDTGPCGPCSEIFYDHGPQVAGGPPGSPDEDGDRYVEIWNLVFMQYDRAADGTLTALPRPSVDTGMGLERLAAVMQGVHSNYDIDLFQRLIEAMAAIAGSARHDAPSLRVIADHIRASAFLIADGVLPGNEGRGYVLRRIIRRAARHGHQLGVQGTFFHRMVAPLVAEMGEAYPELATAQARIEQVLLQEEERFAQTLEQGLKLLEEAIGSLSGDTIPGDTVFQLYDTYGFPSDLTADIARERGLSIDEAGFERAMAAQRESARAASRFRSEAALDFEAVDAETLQRHVFSGYERTVDTARIVALFRERRPVERLSAGEQGAVVLDRTPFYAESGGQVGDAGVIVGTGGRFCVTDTQKGELGAHVHHGELEQGTLTVGESVEPQIDVARRDAIRRNHSATHLLNAALREVLGEHVVQKGSLVAPDRLRFDFSHDQPLTADELRAVEDWVNAAVLRNEAAEIREMSYPEAVAAGALSLAGEAYAEQVRVLRLGSFSMELCGGVHVDRTGDIGAFAILGEAGVSAGVRRIEAVTGWQALAQLREQRELLASLAEQLRAQPADLARRIGQLQAQQRQLEKDNARLKQQLASGQGQDLGAQAEPVGDTQLLVARLDGVDAKTLRETLDQLKTRLQQAAVLLATVSDGKVVLIAGVTRNRTDRLAAGEWVNVAAEGVGGRGGGRPDMAQAGGKDVTALDAALDRARDWARDRLTD